MAVLATLIVVAGCEEKQAAQPQLRTKINLTPPVPPPPPPLEKPAPEPAYPRGGTMQLGDGKTPPGSTGDPNMVRVQAEAGVGKRGQRLNDPRLVQTIVAPARGLFQTEQRMVFEVQIPHALQLYEASNGKKPKTHQEFMEQIIQANQIQLPELPAGQRYVYDPQTGDLMVEKPAE
jgi:hypothetical protein